MTLAEHLGELRRRLIISVARLRGRRDGRPPSSTPRCCRSSSIPTATSTRGNCSFYVTGPLDGLSLRVKMAAFGGLILASPVILWELWRFVTPGLRANEKRYAIPFVVASIIALPVRLRRWRT